jgi:hypothetical protein
MWLVTMNPPDKQARTHVWKKFLGAVQGPLDSIYATGKSWRVSSLRTVLPDHQLADETGIQNKTMTVPKRQREKSLVSVSPQRAVSRHPASEDRIPTNPLPQLTPDIIWKFNKIAEYRKKLETLNRKSQKWQILYSARKEKVLQLQEELTHMAKPFDADSASVRSIERRLEESTAAYKKSDQKMASLRTSLWTYENNIKHSVSRLEKSLRELLSDTGHLQDQLSGPDTSDDGSTRSTKRARTKAESVEALPPPDPEAEEKREAIVLLRVARAHCREIEADFENRSELYIEELEAWKADVAAGRLDTSRTEFDIKWCRDYGDLGLDLAEAENARSTAERRVQILHALPISYSQTSKFADDPEDEAGLQEEAERALATLDASKIEAWLRNIDEAQSPVDQLTKFEADDWDVQSLQFGEGCSGIAEYWVKPRVRYWNLLREEHWKATKRSLHDSDFPLPSDKNSTTTIDAAVAEKTVSPSELQELASFVQGDS